MKIPISNEELLICLCLVRAHGAVEDDAEVLSVVTSILLGISLKTLVA